MCNYLTADKEMRELEPVELTHFRYYSGKRYARCVLLKWLSGRGVYFTNFCNMGVVCPATLV